MSLGRAVQRGAMKGCRALTAMPKHINDTAVIHVPPASVKAMDCNVAMVVRNQKETFVRVMTRRLMGHCQLSFLILKEFATRAIHQIARQGVSIAFGESL